ncbi:MAG: DUF4129 domain-containing protein [Bacteroidota bacterium]|nr:DUF4129 domain-containing protein [Bacteroidota bacterium]
MNRNLPTIYLLSIALFLSLSCFGQDGGRLPDSVSTDVDSTAPAVNQQATGTAEVGPPADASRPDSLVEKVESPIFRTVPDSDFAVYRRDPEFAYAYDPDYWNLHQPSRERSGWLDRVLGSAFWKYLVYALLLGLLGFGLYRIIADNGLYLFYRSPKRAAAERLGEEDPDLADQDLDAKVEEALRAGNLRLATRYLFIKSLRLLDAQELIRYQTKATNEEYIRQIGSQEVSNRFRYLVRAYEHVWYGGFDLNKLQYDHLNRTFQDFYQIITG